MLDDFIPEVEFEAHCPLCDTILIHDYYWYCNGCSVVWEPDGTEGRSVGGDDEFDEMLEELDYS
jgi:hypothetical protein